MKTFTDENYQGYEFRCSTQPSNVGFAHVCEVYKDNHIIDECTSRVVWGNRTWEAYEYASVLDDSKGKVRYYLIEGNKAPEIDYEFLDVLVNNYYICDYGKMSDGSTVILMDGSEQVKGRELYDKQLHKWVVVEPSVYAKLVKLAEKGLLKPSIQSTLQNVEYVFTDEYSKCDDCGRIFNKTWGELTWMEDDCMYLCDDCINSLDRIANLIEQAKEDVRKALKPTVSQDKISELGYSLIDTDLCSLAPDRYCVNNVTIEDVEDFIQRYNGFVQIYQVEQFDCPFEIWVDSSLIDEAQAEIDDTFGERR